MKKITQVILLFLFLPCSFYAMWTPLHQAAADGNLEQAQNLIDEDADINAKNNDGVTPLHEAASGRYAAIVKFLLDRGADVNAADSNNRTPLHLAARKGHEAIARLLLERGAKIDATDNDGWTPLHRAEWQQHIRLITLLTCWENLTKERKAQMYTFLLVIHSPNSPAVSLPNELFLHIWQFVKPTTAEIYQKIAKRIISISSGICTIAQIDQEIAQKKRFQECLSIFKSFRACKK